MKTKAFFQYNYFSASVMDAKQPEEKAERKMVWKSDLKNHRFALIDNKSVHDPESWDSSWFTNYE